MALVQSGIHIGQSPHAVLPTIIYYYDTIEISVLGHYQPSTVTNLLNLLTFVHPVVKPSRSAIKKLLDTAASVSMLASRRIFLAKDCREWNSN